MKKLSVALAMLVTLLVSGCIGMGEKLVAPRLTVVGASMMSGDIFTQQFRIRLHVENPNARPLPIKAIEYKLFLEGDAFADGVSEAPFVVPANGQQEFDLTLKTHFASSIGRLLSRLTGTSRTSIEYVITGSVQIDTTFSPKLKFSESGSVDLARR